MLRSLLAHWSRRKSSSAASRASADERERMLSAAAQLHRERNHRALEALCQTYLAKHGSDPDALAFLANAAVARGDLAAGIEALQRAVAAMPEPSSARLTLARLLVRVNRAAEAVEAYREALAGERNREAAASELAALLNRLGRYDEAERYARSAPRAAAAQHALSRALFEQGRVQESLELLRCLVQAPEVPAGVHSDYLRALNYFDAVSEDAIYAAHVDWARRHADSYSARWMAHGNSADPERRLRVGFVSPHFRQHPVTFFLQSVLAAFDPAQVEIALFSDAHQPDSYSQRLRAAVSSWHDTHTMGDDDLSALIRREQIDVLIDLSGHTPGNRLMVFARRPAPVQMTWNGYPNTTGMRAMDYRITDPLCDPPGATEALHSERLLRLPGPFMSWQTPKDAPTLRAARHGRTPLFGSFNACYKLSDTTLALWTRILTTLPDARLLLAAVPAGIAEQRVRAVFEKSGVDPARLAFQPRVTHEEFLDLHQDVDVALDPFPYHGTTTTCFSLWMGVPVVTLAGTTSAARVGVSLLTHCGLSSLVANDHEQYVRIACELATASDRLQELHATLRARVERSALTDGNACARNLQSAWRDAWRQWCVHSAERAQQQVR
jgi:predicted O-linked N-acetylglucosamine transferase (SPINDLY family)